MLDSPDQDTVGSLLRDRDSVLSATEFDFDLELINTSAYKRALARLQASCRRKGKRRDQVTGSKESRYSSSHRSDTEGSGNELSCVLEHVNEQVEDLIDFSDDPVPLKPPTE
ncbi:Fc.00g006020.m01.CDS01 [Cosmosporella sp. VM-42]